MQHLAQHFSSLSRGRQIALVASLLGIVSVFMTWHSIGLAEIGTQRSFSGLQDQNFIVGVLCLLIFGSVVVLLAMPILGLRTPRLPWRTPQLIAGLGTQAGLLSFVLIFMHSTSITRAAHYDIGFGIQLCLVASIAVLVGGLMSRHERTHHGHTTPLTQAPHVPPATTEQVATSTEPPQAEADADRRMKMDI